MVWLQPSDGRGSARGSGQARVFGAKSAGRVGQISRSGANLHGSPGRDTAQRSGKRYGTRMNMKRMRGRNNNHRGNNGGGGGGGGQQVRPQGGGIPLNRNHVFDSSGPDLRIRGTAQQLFEKYLQLGRDATSGGDRVMAESYFQHAEHYFRILNAMAQATTGQAPQQQQQQRPPRQHESNGPEIVSHNDVDSLEAELMQAQLRGGAHVNGLGDQPEGEAVVTRDIPIAMAPPEE